MKEWFTAAELAGLPGLPGSERNARERARREQWRSVPRQGRGGGREYHLSSLPREARIELARRHLSQQASLNNVRERIVIDGLAASAREEARTAAMCAVVDLAARFCECAMLQPGPLALQSFATLYNTAALSVPEWVRSAVPHVSGRNLLRWRERRAKGGAPGLIRRYGRREGASAFDAEDIQSFVVGQLAARPHLDAVQLHKGLRARFEGRSIPHVRSLQRWLARWKAENGQLLLAIGNPDRHRSHLMPAFGSASEDAIGLNDLWEIDTTPQDVITSDGRRNALIGVIDVWSRRAKILVAPTSKALAVTAALRRAILAWGVPARIKSDRGRDYTARHVVRALADLGIEHVLCPPYTPQGKPHVERFLQTTAYQFLELLPGFVGHNVAERQAIEARRSFAERREQEPPVEVKLTAAELQTMLDQWCEVVYGREHHRDLGCSPFLRAVQWQGPVRRIDDERALDVLLAEVPDRDGIRMVGKKGIAVDGTYFIAPELGPILAIEDRQVRVRYDPENAGRIYVFKPAGEFICVAEAPERTGVDRRNVAIEAKRRWEQTVAEGRKRLRKLARQARTGTLAQEILEKAKDEADNVLSLPQAAAVHSTLALRESAKVVRALEPPQAAPLSPRAQQIMTEMRAREANPPPRPKSEVQIKDEPFAAWRALDARIQAGEAVSDDDRRWHRVYPNTAEWRARKRIAEYEARLRAEEEARRARRVAAGAGQDQGENAAGR